MNQQWPRVAQIERPIGQAREPMARSGDHAADRPEVSAGVADLWRILVRRRWTVLATALLFGLPALLYAFLATPLYTAVSQILIDPRDRQVVTNDLNATPVSPDGGVTQVESQVRVIESDSVLLRAVADAGLEADPEFGAVGDGLVSRVLRSLQATFAGPDTSAVTSKARALRNLRRKLAVKRADKVFVVDVIVTATSPEKAARIVNAIAKAYLVDQADARSEAARRASAELRARLETLRADVNKAETKLESFKAAHGLIASSGQLVGEQQLTEHNARLVAARNRTSEAKSRLEGVRDARGRALDPGSLPEAISSPVIDRLRGQYAELTSKEADLRTQLGANHPAMVAVRTQKAEVQRLIAAELGRIVQAAEVEYQRALANERLLAANLEKLRAEAVERGKANVQLRELEREVEATRSVYNAFLLRSREISEQAGVDPTNARVITWARPPDERSWPLRLVIIGAGLVGGLGCGLGLALMREYAKPTLLSRQQLERLLDAPVLATLAWPVPRRAGKGRAQAETAFALDSLQELNDPSGDHRALCVLITAVPSDATARKDVVDLLARVAAARGDRILVVEADLGAPELEGAGLLDVLRGESDLGAVSNEDPETGVRRVRLGSGQRMIRDALERDNVRRFLADVRARFDFILFDGGALSENLRLGPLAVAVDQHVVVARGGRTLQADLIDAAKMAKTMRLPIAGALLLEGRP